MMAGYEKRISFLEKAIRDRGLDSFLVTSEINVRYLCGFEGGDSQLFFTPKGRYFLTDSRYSEEASETLKGFEIIMVTSSNYQTLTKLMAKDRLRRIGFESMNLSYEVVARLGEMTAKGRRLLPFKDLIETMRAVKDPDEISSIRRSVALAKGALKKALKILRPGVSEKAVSAKVETEFIEEGASAAYKPIVAFGRNSSRPHARPTDDTLKPNQHVMMDIGCSLNGYNSDLTRVAMLGRVKEAIKKIYRIVHDAQERAIEMIRPGIRISEIDLAARRHIQGRGFGKYFSHSTGHGVGLEVHEKPSISRINQEALKPGMVFTVEPAIYIPKIGGVRIEDMALVTDRGCEILTR